MLILGTMKVVLNIVWLFILLHADVVFAQPTDEMQYFIGKWDVQLMFSSNKTNKPDVKATWEIEKGLDSAFCLLGHVYIKKAIFTRETIVYNTTTKEYIRNVITNDGSYFVFTTKGWQGNNLLWTGIQYSKDTVSIQENITRINKKEFRVIYFRMQDGYWEQANREIVKKLK